jgi:hypothetical protein
MYLKLVNNCCYRHKFILSVLWAGGLFVKLSKKLPLYRFNVINPISLCRFIYPDLNIKQTHCISSNIIMQIHLSWFKYQTVSIKLKTPSPLDTCLLFSKRSIVNITHVQVPLSFGCVSSLDSLPASAVSTLSLASSRYLPTTAVWSLAPHPLSGPY